jgi:arylamine N-acetyltransferase
MSRTGCCRCKTASYWKLASAAGKPFYRFTLEPQFPADYEVSNWYLCHHPSSFIRQELQGERATQEGRYALRNNALAIHRRGGTEKRTWQTPRRCGLPWTQTRAEITGIAGAGRRLGAGESDA